MFLKIAQKFFAELSLYILSTDQPLTYSYADTWGFFVKLRKLKEDRKKLLANIQYCIL